MNDYADLIILVAVIGVFWLASRLPVWRRCRCGAQYCTTCSRRR